MPTTARSILLLASSALAAAGLSLLSGCRGNATSAAILGKVEASPPAIAALPASGNPANADPLTDLPWLQTHFTPFANPINTDRSTPPARAALLYGPDAIYVAFVNDSSLSSPTDTDSIYLDTSATGDGREMVQVTVDHAGHASLFWIRSDDVITKRPDGSPDFTHPLATIPKPATTGLTAHVHDASEHGRPVWTATVTIPFSSLPATPLPLKNFPQPGDHWKINLLRTITNSTTAGTEILQSNLSPVYVNAQPVSPYRLADLTLSPMQFSSNAPTP